MSLYLTYYSYNEMRILKTHSLAGLLNSYMIDSPQPSNITYSWNGGSLLGLCLITQLATGIFLALHYIGSADLSFVSVEAIMRDTSAGWILRYLHANTASLFFVVIYLHISRGLWYGSYRGPRTLTWNIGVVIFILLMGTAFLGYVLPYGQMSHWGGTVIINLASALPWLGNDIKEFLWGAYSVSSPTVTRFFTFHYTAAFILAAIAAAHLIALHEHGSGNPLGVTANSDRVAFHPYFTIKDGVTVFALFIGMLFLVSYMPNVLGHSDNYIKANPMSTPLSIVPEWYLLPYYAILRSIPSKIIGVLGMLGSIIILMALPYLDLAIIRGSQHRPLIRMVWLFFAICFIILLILGSRHVESPYILQGQIVSIAYFATFVFLVPVVGLIENTLIRISKNYSVLSPLLVKLKEVETLVPSVVILGSAAKKEISGFKKFKKDFILGFKKAYNVDFLPPKLVSFNNRLAVRGFRVLGGVCLFLILSKLQNHFYDPVRRIIFILGLSHMAYFMFINIVKLVYGAYLIVCKPQLFEVRNSPFNFPASAVGKVVACAKWGICYGGTTIAFLLLKSKNTLLFFF